MQSVNNPERVKTEKLARELKKMERRILWYENLACTYSNIFKHQSLSEM